ncbi:MAG TPA: cobalamin-dependent protein [Dehalococcoidales bacterium]
MPDLLQELKQAVVEGEDDQAQRLSQKALEDGLDPMTIVKQAIVAGIQEAGALWKQNRYFQTDMIMSAEAFRAAMEVIEPRLSGTETSNEGRCVLGTVAGDMHNLGKMMVVVMLRGAGFQVMDLGEDVSSTTFIEKVKELKPDILGLGCYMTTTIGEMESVISGLKENGLRNRVKVMVGGVPLTQQIADALGADAWGKDALDAVDKARKLMEVKK